MPRGECPPPVRAVCVEIHDVAPATWPLCERLLRMVDAIGDVPVTLLLVPDFHQQGASCADQAFVAAIDQRVGRGDELTLHGYYHVDRGRAPRNPADWFRRRVRTLGEGEFAALDGVTARALVARGLEAMHAVGWEVPGFVPPAWLLGSAARSALADSGLRYVALRECLYRLPGWQPLPTTTLSYAAFSGWRRALSRPVLDGQLRRAPPQRPLRLALHPVDARYPQVIEHWRRLLRCALQRRAATTVQAVIDSGIAPAAQAATTRRDAPLARAMPARHSAINRRA